MLCDRCKMKEAKIYYTEITGGKKIEQHLCEDCAAELTSFQKEIPLESLLSGLLGMGSGSHRDRVCPVCGMSYQEFQKAGKFGCEHCYKTFGRLHQGTLKRIQGATAHTGKIAASWQREQARQQEAALQQESFLQEENLPQTSIVGEGSAASSKTPLPKAEQGNAQTAETTAAETIQNDGQHTLQQQEGQEKEIAPLEQALKEAIAKEEYEEAARLRDEIRSLKASKEEGGCVECQKND